MTRLLLASAVLAVVAPLAGFQNPPPEPVRGGPLRIDVVAIDDSGNPVMDLRPEEFEVWIGGFRVPIDIVDVVMPSEDVAPERSIALVLDDVTVQPPLTERVRQGARLFVERMEPGDRIAIVRLNGDSIEPTSDRARLLSAINNYETRLLGVVRVDGLGEQVLKTVAAIARAFPEGSPHRHTIVGIGTAWLFDRPIPPPSFGFDLRADWVDAMRAMAFAHASLYVIDPAGVGTSRYADSGSSGFARETGGIAFMNTNDVSSAVNRIMREAGHYYVLNVTDPPARRKAQLRELDVRVLRRGVTLRARRSIPGSR